MIPTLFKNIKGVLTMGFFSILLMIIKYGPAVFNLIRTAIELIRWLRSNDEESSLKFADEAPIAEDLKTMAKRSKKSKDLSELKNYVDSLKARKDKVMARKMEAEAQLKGL